MRLPRACLAALALATAAFPTQLRSQACAGFPSLRDTRVNVEAHAASYTYATALGASAAMGRTAFGVLGIGRTHDAELDATTIDIGLAGGVDVAIGPARRDFLCPVIGLTVSLGPSDFLLRPEAHRRVTAEIGVDLAVDFVRWRGVAVQVTGGVRVVRLTFRETRSSYERFTSTERDTYEVISLGVSVILHNMLTLRSRIAVPLGLESPVPSGGFAVPFGRKNEEVAADISIGVGFGRKRTAR